MVERQTAIKVSVHDLTSGRYVQKEGWDPNYVETRFGHVSRASIMGVITQVIEQGVFMLDDGSGQIKLRTFDKPSEAVVGDPVHVIGRPREYAGELFVNYEFIKKVKPGWLEFRKTELARATPVEEAPQTKVVDAEVGEVVVHTAGENLFTKVIDAVRFFDKESNGQGADVQAVLGTITNPEAERVLQNLLEEGELFEIKPGKVKVLE